jgi:hypothetical protein
MQEGHRVDSTAMTLERLQARAAAGVPDLDGPVSGRRRQLGGVVREGHRVDRTAMALGRLQACAAAGVPNLDSPVPGRRRQPVGVVQEGHRHDLTAMALERLQARVSVIAHRWHNANSFWLFVLKELSDETTCWTEQERRCICL